MSIPIVSTLMQQSKRKRREEEKQQNNNILIIRKPYNPDKDDVDFYKEYNLKLHNSGMKEIEYKKLDIGYF
jgi:hypothetical protein